MTTIEMETLTCALCGAQEEHTVLNSTNTYGSPDLDCRPPPMQRWTINMWAQECAACGYAAPNVDAAEPGAREVVESEAYRTIDAGDVLATRFLRVARLADARGDTDGACEWTLIAVWALDDAEDVEGARALREQAIGLFKAALTSRTAEANTERALIRRMQLLDIFRRARQWDDAVAHAQGMIDDTGAPGHFRNIARFGKRLAEQRDDSRRTIEEASGT